MFDRTIVFVTCFQGIIVQKTTVLLKIFFSRAYILEDVTNRYVSIEFLCGVWHTQRKYISV
jgi:hypothetical protein